MKMFAKLKRVLACLLAVAMLAAALTACGGGGGGGGTGGTSTSATKLANTALATGGNVTLEGTLTVDSASAEITVGSNGTNTYMRMTAGTEDMVYVKTGSVVYSVDMTDDTKTAVDDTAEMSDVMALIEVIVNAKDNLANAQNGKVSVDGTEYYSENITVTVEGAELEIDYCFDDNGTLKYIAVFKGDSDTASLAIAVDSVKSSVDSSLLTTDGWTSNNNTTTPTEKVTVSVTSIASYGLVSGAGVYNKGDDVTMTATPATGYTFVCWQKDGTTVSTSASYTFTASESVTLTAVFEEEASSETDGSEGITWSVSETDGGVIITGYEGTLPANLVLPSKIEGKKVVGIGKAAFQGNTDIVTVEFPNTIKTIYEQAFMDCGQIKSVVLPDSVEEMGASVFQNCTSLKYAKLPDGLYTISSHTFSGCSSLSEVVIPDSVKVIGIWAFSDCKSLKDIDLPEEMISIGRNAFEGCTSLRRFIVPEGITTIEAYTFRYDKQLTIVYIPSSVVDISISAFELTKDYTSSLVKTVYYAGSQTDWEYISGYNSLSDRSKVYNSTREDALAVDVGL